MSVLVMARFEKPRHRGPRRSTGKPQKLHEADPELDDGGEDSFSSMTSPRCSMAISAYCGRNLRLKPPWELKKPWCACRWEGHFAVLVADMRMPEMDGAQLLAKVIGTCPGTIRIMLTGNLDIQTAIRAVNEGSIFRFLTKPCEKDTLIDALKAALAEHRLAGMKMVLPSRCKGRPAAVGARFARRSPGRSRRPGTSDFGQRRQDAVAFHHLWSVYRQNHMDWSRARSAAHFGDRSHCPSQEITQRDSRHRGDGSDRIRKRESDRGKRQGVSCGLRD